MISVEDARQKICSQARVQKREETLSLEQAFDRVLAQNAHASVSHPPQANSAMDGYALALDEQQTTDKSNALSCAMSLAITQTIAAGTEPKALEPGSAARILTGAVIPAGANCVVIQENCRREADTLSIAAGTQLVVGDNIRPMGQDFKQDQLLVRRGEKLDASKVALLAAAGVKHVVVFAPIKVAVVSTGDELIELGHELRTGQIYNSNQYMLQHLLSGWGVEVAVETIIADKLDDTVDQLREVAQKVDLIVTSGGVSVGDEDHLKNAVEQIGHIDLWKVHMKPGKPMAYGHINMGQHSKAIFCLPGNPVSAFVTAWLFLQPYLLAMCAAPYRGLNPHHAPADFEMSPRSRPEFARARYRQGKLSLYQNQSSGVISSLAWADTLIFVDAGQAVKTGDILPYYLIKQS